MRSQDFELGRGVNMVAIVGLSAINGLGNTKEEIFAKLFSDLEVGTKPSYLSYAFDTSSALPDVSEVAWDCEEILRRLPFGQKSLKKLSRSSLLALYSVKEALEDAGDELAFIARHRIGIFCGTSLGGANDLEGLVTDYERNGKARGIHRALSGKLMNIVDEVADRFKITGPRSLISTACSSSSLAIKAASLKLKSGEIDAAIVIGVDPVTKLTLAGFHALGAQSKEKCRPFSIGEPGLMLGEGAAVLVLKAGSSTKAKWGWLGGAGVSLDGYHPTAPEPSGKFAKQAMLNALSEAGVSIEEVDAIYAHGTGTELNDLAETRAIQSTFGERAPQLEVLSTKGFTGHTLGGAGAVNAVMACLSLHNGRVPPTAGFLEPRKSHNLNYNFRSNKRCELKQILTNSFGFGGTNGSVLVSSTPSSDVNANQGRIFITGQGSLTPGGTDFDFLSSSENRPPFSFIKKTETNVSFSGRKSTGFHGLVDMNSDKVKAVLRRSPNQRKFDRLTSLAYVAGQLAMTSAGLKLTTREADSAAIVIGTDSGPMEVIQKFFSPLVDRSYKLGNPGLFPNSVANACLGWMATDFSIRGPSFMVWQAETSALGAIDISIDLLRSSSQNVQRVLCGGVDEYSTYLEKGYLDLNHILDKVPTDLESFRHGISGYFLAEGSVQFVLEKESAVAARKAKPLAEVFGSMSSGASIPGPHSFEKNGDKLVEFLDAAVKKFGHPDGIVTNQNGLRQLDNIFDQAFTAERWSKTPRFTPNFHFGYMRGASGALGVAQGIRIIQDCENCKLIFVVNISVGGLMSLVALGKVVS